MVLKGRMNWLRVILTLCCVLAVTLGGMSAAWAKGGNPMVKLTTSKGDIVIELDKEKAPATTANFLNYVKKGHYDGLIFHRVIPGFMVQGGGMDKAMKEKATDAPIQNEADNGLKNKAYTLAMARTGDPHSATAQFFINVADNGFLDHTGKNPQGWGYAVFGKVVSGQEVVDAIKAVPTMTKGFHENVPVAPVVIEKAEVVSE
ncbi:peptidyl-prolyl cis-trans isomerase [Desulfovibrio aerotolerans]|uniref:Peptidyl-prolyl cis-trans isomerase n=1 Tax=Solidesulfovibrio aerotolerans TaxID=295255 RepID=A0A7C9MKM7_9BACT|nr:peptidylprolyl isomerase [Solidesulfovibrio aerotolerans]MYL84429.1 peptidyl-prolyl cis-trans isomerase [Solidesulfovibrio aerotolerans]